MELLEMDSWFNAVNLLMKIMASLLILLHRMSRHFSFFNFGKFTTPSSDIWLWFMKSFLNSLKLLQIV